MEPASRMAIGSQRDKVRLHRDVIRDNRDAASKAEAR